MRPIHKVLLLLLPYVAFAQERERVPKELFGVSLDATYQLKEDGSNTLPVAKVAGVIRTPGMGIHLYFEPLQKDQMFPYVEYPDWSNEYLMTSYRLFLLPVIADDVDTREELGAVSEFRVVLIEWSNLGDGGKRNNDSYSWAVDLCESMAGDLGLQPDVRDSSQDNWHICTFAGPERELEVSGGPHAGFPIVGPERELEIASQFGKAISLQNRNAIAEMVVLDFE